MTAIPTETLVFDLRAYNCDRVETCLVADLPAGPDAYVLEPKFDGFRIVAHVTDDGVESWTRSMKPQAGKIPYVDEELRYIAPPGTVFDGEIVALQRFRDPETDELVVVNDFEHVQSVMLSKPDRAVRRAAEVRPLDYIIFDVMYWGGEDLRTKPYEERRILLEQVNTDRMSKCQRVSLSPQYPADQRVHDRLCAVGFEGTIAKHLATPYRSGDRGARKRDLGVGWYKLKTQDWVDAVCVDVKPGTIGSSWEHLAGALFFGQPLHEMPVSLDRAGLETRVIQHPNGRTVEYVIRGSCSGITMTERERITRIWNESPGDLFGRVMQFGHMGKYPDGVRYRHPQFKGWRDDKPATEVTWS